MKSLTETAVVLGACAAFASADTIYTGDTLSGYPVISALDINDVPSNKISRFWLSPGAGQGGLGTS